MNGETKKFDLSDRLFIIAAVLIIVIALSIVVGIYFTVKSLPGQEPKELTVSSTGKIYTIPDIATVSISVTNEGNEQSDIPTMIQKNTEEMNTLIADLKDLGIDEKDIKTTQYNLEPRYNWTEYQGQIFIGYRITNTILVKIRDFTKIGSVLSKATDGGATSIGNIYFTIEDPEKARQEAREKAIEQAKDKAENIAKASGLKLVKLLNVSEDYYSSYDRSETLLKEGAGGAAPAEPEIQPGQQEVSTTVYLTYRIK